MVNEASDRVTLKLLAAAARILYRLRLVFVAIAVGAGVWFGVAVFADGSSSIDALTALAVFLWATLSVGIGHTLSRPPAPVAAHDGFLRRLRQRVLLMGYGLAVLISLGLLVMVAGLSLRLVGLSAQ